MTQKRKDGIVALLKGIETGDPAAVNVINPNQYIQHNPQTHEGREGLAALFKRLALTSPRVNIVRIFSDGDFVFGHTEYDFSARRVGFEVFRFEGDQTVEHWDNIQSRKGPNPSGHSMVDGETEVADLEQTEANRASVGDYVTKVLIERQWDLIERFVHADLIEHNPAGKNGLAALRATLSHENLRYERNHRILAEGNFVLSVSEGFRGEVHTAFYDLFRLSQGKIAEHWDTTEAVPPQAVWQNDNGKF